MKSMKLYPCFNHWLHGGQIYIYSDPHFGDEYNHMLRPNNVDDDTQVANINSKVTKNDTIIFLGDICDKEFVKKVRGYKVLITGNHDKGSTTYQRASRTESIPCNKYLEKSFNEMWFDANQKFPNDEKKQEEYVDDLLNQARTKVYEELKSEPDFIFLDKEPSYSNHSPFISWKAYYDNRLFDEVYNGALTISPNIILSHEPILNYPFAFNIHGHDHGQKVKDDKHYNCCAELINYTPVCLKDIISSGVLHDIPDIHQTTIDVATARKLDNEKK